MIGHQESQKEVPEKVTMDVCLMNGHKITVNVNSMDQTDDVLEVLCLFCLFFLSVLF